jgi:Lrp/AsnC family transcriptional regulator, leucine-responsive regulatory protein
MRRTLALRAQRGIAFTAVRTVGIATIFPRLGYGRNNILQSRTDVRLSGRHRRFQLLLVKPSFRDFPLYATMFRIMRDKRNSMSTNRPMELDEIDLKILLALQENARMTNVELAERVGLSPAPCLRRVASLEKSGAIKKYVALLDHSALKRPITMFVRISLDLLVGRRIEIFENAVMKIPEIQTCYLTTGDADYYLKIVLPSVESYETFVKNSLSPIEGVASIKSTLALKEVKYTTALPLGREETSKAEVKGRAASTVKGKSRRRKK